MLCNLLYESSFVYQDIWVPQASLQKRGMYFAREVIYLLPSLSSFVDVRRSIPLLGNTHEIVWFNVKC